jgi:hypothetical protein
MNHRARIAAIVAAGMLLPSAVASAQSKVYPPGTDCANQATIAERLLCGRQEFRRQSETALPQPAPQPGIDRIPDEEAPASSPVDEDAIMAIPQTSQPRTASPNH